MPDFDWTKFQTQGQEAGKPVPVNTIKFDYSQFENQERANQGPPPGLENTQALSAVTGFANVVSKLTAGIINKFTPAGNTINNAANSSRDFVRHATELSRQVNPVSTSLGELAGEITKTAPLVAATGGLGAAASIAATTAGSAAMGYLDNPEDGQSREGNAAAAGIGGLVGSSIGSAVQGIMKMLPTSKIAKFAAEAGKNTEAEAAAKNLGVEVSPFESTKSVNLAKAPLQKIGMTPDRAATLDKALVERETKLTDVLNTTMQKVAPDRELESSIYNNLAPRQIDETITSKIMPSTDTKAAPSYVQRLYKEAHDPKTGINFEGVKPGSFEDLKITRDYINSKIDSVGASVATAGKKGASSTIKGPVAQSLKNAKKVYTEALHSVSSPEELPVAEQLAKQSGFMKYVDDKISKISLSESGQANPTPVQIYKKLFGSPIAKKNFYSKLDNALANHPEKAAIKQTFKDWETVMNQIQDSPLDKLLGKNQFQSRIPVKEMGEAGLATYAAGPVVGATTFGSRVGGKMISSKGYFNQIWKPLPEAAINPGQTTKEVIQGGGVLTGQEANS